MKISEYKCPNCGGTLEFNKNNSCGECEYCGTKVNIKTEVSDRIIRGFDLISQGKFVSAEEIMNEVLKIDVNCGDAYLGLLLCDNDCITINELIKSKRNIKENFNYKKAVELLDYDKKNELINISILNNDYLEYEKKFPTELMEKFIKLSTHVLSNGYTLIQLYLSIDFESYDDKEIIDFYLNTKEKMEEIITLFNSLSKEEIMHLENFDINDFEACVDLFNQLKSIVESITEDEMNAILNDELDEAEAEDDNIETLDENDYQKNSNKRFVEYKYYNMFYENDELVDEKVVNRILDEIDHKISSIQYELGGLGLFNHTKKNILKKEIKNLEIERSDIIINYNICDIEEALIIYRSNLEILNSVDKRKVEEAKYNYNNTPLTAFKRRKELKDYYLNLKNNYELEIAKTQQKIKELNSELKKLRKQIK